MLVGIILAAISWAPLACSGWSLIGCAIDGCVGVIIQGPVLNVLGLVSNGTIHSPVRLPTPYYPSCNYAMQDVKLASKQLPVHSATGDG